MHYGIAGTCLEAALAQRDRGRENLDLQPVDGLANPLELAVEHIRVNGDAQHRRSVCTARELDLLVPTDLGLELGGALAVD